MSRPGPRLVLLASAVLVLTSSVTSGLGRSATPTTSVRGLWVPRSALASPDSIAAMVSAAEAGGFNTLLVQVRGRGEAFYQSDIEPRSTDLDRQPAAFDPLAETIALARRAGLAVHAWVNVNLVASGTSLPRSRDHVAAKHPDWLMVPKALAGTLSSMNAWSPAYLGTLARWTRGASQVEGLYVSPVTAVSRAYSAGVVAELATRYPLDGIHFDYIRYPSPDFDYSRAALAEFRAGLLSAVTRVERARLDRAAVRDPAAWPSAYPKDWAAFHRDRMTALVMGLQSAARAVRPGLVVSAAVVGVPAEAREARFQDWVTWTRQGLIDVACPMLYVMTADQFGATAADIRAALGPAPFWAGIGAYRLSIDATIERVRAARRANAAGVLLFSYGQLAEGSTTPAPAALAALRPVLLENSNGSTAGR